jgi:hypothetical protein
LRLNTAGGAAFDAPQPGMLALAGIELLTHSTQTRLLLREILAVSGWTTVKNVNSAGTHHTNLDNVSSARPSRFQRPASHFRRQRFAPKKPTVVSHQLLTNKILSTRLAGHVQVKGPQTVAIINMANTAPILVPTLVVGVPLGVYILFLGLTSIPYFQRK